MNGFDPVFYLVNFLTFGWKEGRDPSRWFDTSFISRPIRT